VLELVAVGFDEVEDASCEFDLGVQIVSPPPDHRSHRSDVKRRLAAAHSANRPHPGLHPGRATVAGGTPADRVDGEHATPTSLGLTENSAHSRTRQER